MNTNFLTRKDHMNEYELEKIPSKWKVDVKGNHKGGEICLIRENFLHGFRSYGWEHPNKKICIHAVDTLYHKQLSKRVWEFAIKEAHKECDIKNLKEGWK